MDEKPLTRVVLLSLDFNFTAKTACRTSRHPFLTKVRPVENSTDFRLDTTEHVHDGMASLLASHGNPDALQVAKHLDNKIQLSCAKLQPKMSALDSFQANWLNQSQTLVASPFRQHRIARLCRGNECAVNRLVTRSLSLQDWKMCSQRLPDRTHKVVLFALQRLNAR
jgi:hypothetical protein